MIATRMNVWRDSYRAKVVPIHKASRTIRVVDLTS